MTEKLQKLMARAGIGSRRKCEELIRAGRVKVNDHVAAVGQRADPEVDSIKIDGRSLRIKPTIYIKAYKPKGILSSTVDELGKNRPTLMDMVGLDEHLFPVGRLDKQSEGLILLTNDGPLTHRLTHPRYMHEKVYLVTAEGYIKDDDLDRWRNGLILDGKRTAPAKIKILHRDSDATKLQITLREGKKRQIRRIAAGFGHPIIRLIRIKIGPLEIGNLKPGEWRHLSHHEIDTLRRISFKSKL